MLTESYHEAQPIYGSWRYCLIDHGLVEQGRARLKP